jgi:hypothetical protein
MVIRCTLTTWPYSAGMVHRARVHKEQSKKRGRGATHLIRGDTQRVSRGVRVHTLKSNVALIVPELYMGCHLAAWRQGGGKGLSGVTVLP